MARAPSRASRSCCSSAASRTCSSTCGSLACSLTGSSPARRTRTSRPCRSEDPMSDTSEQPKHKFRYLLQPGTNFQFVRKFKLWVIGSLILMSASIASLFINKEVRGDYMNWTIDFKGGSEIIFAFKDKQTDQYTSVQPAKVRAAFEQANEKGVELSDISYRETTP